MGVVFESAYSLPSGDEPLTHARILHSGLWATGGTISATSTDSDYFVDGPSTSLTYEKWRPTGASASWTQNGFPSQTVDCICIGAHTLGSAGSSVTVQTWSGSSWLTKGTVSPADDSDLFFIFEPVTTTGIRVTIGTSIAEIGVIKGGEALQMQRPLYGGHTPLALARQTIMRSNMSATGEFLGRTKQRTMFQTSFAWSHLTAGWVRSNWPTLQRGIETEPFFIAWRPETFSEAALCYIEETPIPENQGMRDFMSVSMNVTGYGYD